MNTAPKQKTHWRKLMNSKTETSLMHIVRAADQLQTLLPMNEGESWSWWQFFGEPKLVETRAKENHSEKFEIESRVRDELPPLNRFGF